MLLSTDMAFYKKIVLFFFLSSIPNISAHAQEHEIGFFFLKDKKINAVDASSLPLEGLVLEEVPFWTADSFEEYRCPSHEFKLTAKATATVPMIENVRGIPFVLKVSGKNNYLGAFFSFFSSEVFPNPVVESTFIAPIGKIWKLYRAYPHDDFGQGTDPRSMPEFMNELQIRGKLIEACLTI